MKKLIYLLIVIAVVAAIAALWIFFGSAPKAVAPASSSQTSSALSVKSAYFDEKTNSTLGTYLTDNKGITLYTFTHDLNGVSNCTGACLQKWPPYGPGVSATGATSINLPMLPENVGAIKGNNGMIQLTWKGAPLYYYFQDKAPGDAFGEGILGAWYVIKI